MAITVQSASGQLFVLYLMQVCAMHKPAFGQSSLHAYMFALNGWSVADCRSRESVQHQS